MEIAERSLKDAALWDEVKDRLNDNAYTLSGGQQQRLCIARCMALEPDVLLLDEPTSALDPVSSFKIEDLISQLKKQYTIAIVTHSMQQASRVSDRTAFFLHGEVIEYDETRKVFFQSERFANRQLYFRTFWLSLGSRPANQPGSRLARRQGDLSMHQQEHRIKVKSEALNLFYGDFQALKNVTLDIMEKQITALIGPSAVASRRI